MSPRRPGRHRAASRAGVGPGIARGVVPRLGLLPTLVAVLALSAAAPTLDAPADDPVPAPVPARVTAPDIAQVPGPAPEPTYTSVPTGSQEAAEPRRVVVPRAGIDVGLEELAVDDEGRLQAPRAWQQAGWFAEGVAPGDVGPAVIAGHVDSPSGPAAFTGLDRVRPGDEVLVERADGTTARFVVDRVLSAPKGDFPTQAVYGATPDAQLRLITCDGAYVRDAGGYQDNLVVLASAVTS